MLLQGVHLLVPYPLSSQVPTIEGSAAEQLMSEEEETLRDELSRTQLQLHITEDELEQRRLHLQALFRMANPYVVPYESLDTDGFECVE